MEFVWHRIDAELTARQKTWAWLARELGSTDQVMYNWKQRGVPSKRHADIATALGWTVDRLIGLEAENPDTETSINRSVGVSETAVAQYMSQRKGTLPLRTIEWEKLVEGGIPTRFQTRIPDDAVAPLVPAGSIVTFDSSITQPRPGDGVLVRDGAGTFHFRRYRAGRPGHWEAYSSNDAYRLLESERDGLQLVAVYVGSEHRLG